MLTILDEESFRMDKMLICLSGQHEMTRDFSGFRNLFTLNFFPKPLYHAYKLSAKLGGEKLSCDKPYVGKTYSIFPTRRDGGSVAVLFTHCTDDLCDTAEEEITLTFKNIRGNARIWTIDGETANAYAFFQKMGAPENLSEEQILQIRNAAQCEPVTAQLSEDNRLCFIAKKNSVTLVEIIP